MNKMDKNIFQPLKGFRDFLPEDMVVRNKVINILRDTFNKYGYEELITPSIEKQAILLGKYGEEAEKLMYLFEDNGQRSVGLRYDLTVPLARVMANNQDLPIPFKRYQIQPVWRADKPQKGRYREIYQCDIDCVGSNSPYADSEVILIINEVLSKLGFTDFEIRINSRQVLYNTMQKNKIPQNLQRSIILTIDKLEKKSKEEVIYELVDKGLSKKSADDLLTSINTAQPDEFLTEVLDTLEKLSVNNIKFTPTLSRGLDYYTGPIFETVVTKLEIGSLTGGGRYDNLLADLGGPDLPATGTSFGLDRICDVITELGIWEKKKTDTEVLICVFSNLEMAKALETAQKIRSNEINCDVYPIPSAKLDKQFKYANKRGIPWVIVIGPNEITTNKFTLKNLKTGEQKLISFEDLISAIK